MTSRPLRPYAQLQTAMVLLGLGGYAAAALPPVPAALEPVTNTYHGEVVVDKEDGNLPALT